MSSEYAFIKWNKSRHKYTFINISQEISVMRSRLDQSFFFSGEVKYSRSGNIIQVILKKKKKECQ